MSWWVILLIALFAALVIFLIAPVVFIFVAVFSRKETKPFEEYDWEKFKDHYYVPYLGRIEAARSFVRGHSVKRVSVMSYDGLKLSGDYYDLGCKRTAILFHGFNAEVSEQDLRQTYLPAFEHLVKDAGQLLYRIVKVCGGKRKAV